MEEQKAPRLTTPILESVMPELLEIIFSFLSVQDVASCCRVCQAWHDLVVGKPPHEDLSTLLWRQLLERDYPHVPTDKSTPWLIQYQTLSTFKWAEPKNLGTFSRRQDFDLSEGDRRFRILKSGVIQTNRPLFTGQHFFELVIHDIAKASKLEHGIGIATEDAFIDLGWQLTNNGIGWYSLGTFFVRGKMIDNDGGHVTFDVGDVLGLWISFFPEGEAAENYIEFFLNSERLAHPGRVVIDVSAGLPLFVTALPEDTLDVEIRYRGSNCAAPPRKKLKVDITDMDISKGK